MPYIPQPDRESVALRGPIKAGEINYCLSLMYQKAAKDSKLNIQKEMKNIITAYIKAMGINYQVFNDVIGAMYLSEREFVRRTSDIQTSGFILDAITATEDFILHKYIEPYEDEKIEQNGDVYGSDQ
jgi:hypothetical protein